MQHYKVTEQKSEDKMAILTTKTTLYLGAKRRYISTLPFLFFLIDGWPDLLKLFQKCNKGLIFLRKHTYIKHNTGM